MGITNLAARPLLIACLLAATSTSLGAPAFDVDRARVERQSAGEWLMHGRAFGEQRYSPLARITTENVGRLGLAWQHDMATERGLEATPLMVDGVLFLTGAWSTVHALDARTGRELWVYDPKVPGATGRNGCCDVVNRGVAVWEGVVYSATFDGRLLALDARTGKLRWQVDTIVDHSLPYTVTGAPRIAKDKVVIGNGGAELGVRGYVSAYDVATGRLAWRFYTIPKDLDGPFENPELVAAAKTWDPTTNGWHNRGGGTVWDSMTYDPALNLLYVGTGNAPWTGAVPDPGEGDKLYVGSVLALDPDTGRMVWYYQETPGDRWDFTSTQHLLLADLVLGGRTRQVLLHAPKNGFFYVLDRRSGELLSAEKYGLVTWASHVDMKTGRPVLTERAQYWKKPNGESLVVPWVAGAHNWQPMSFSPRTGLVYIPAQQSWWVHSTRRYTHFDETIPEATSLAEGAPVPPVKGYLRAWDPVAARVAWEVETPTVSNGGTLVTAGDLVFQGAGDGYLSAYDARDGRLLKRIFTGTGIVAAPISYELDGVQYVAVLAGFGGATFFMLEDRSPARQYLNTGRLLVFRLDGGEVPLPAKRPAPAARGTFSLATDEAEVQKGIGLYRVFCGRCHGMLTSRSVLPDLRDLPDDKHAVFADIVLGGLLAPRGMASFADLLTPDDVRAIQAAILWLRDHPEYGPTTVDPALRDRRPGY
jgi:quinohemoprotein ethanol dehydrogenase